MNVASLFNLYGSDLIVILLITLLIFGGKKRPDLFRGIGEAIQQFMEARRRWMGKEARHPEELENPVAIVNRLLVPAAIIIFLLACGLWFFGSDH